MAKTMSAPPDRHRRNQRNKFALNKNPSSRVSPASDMTLLHSFLLRSLLVLAVSATPALAQQPDAESIMRGARMSAALVQVDHGLTGRLQKGFRKIPLQLFLLGGELRFEFTIEKTPEVFHMRLGEESCSLFRMKNGKRVNLSPDELVSPIADTDLTYEDLSLRFLYWPRPKLEGSEKVTGQDCYKIRINRPSGASGNYETVYVWVHHKFGAFMRVRGHDKNGNLIKEFQVEDVMQIDDHTWTLRKMQVSTHNPKNGRRTSLTDVNFDTPNQGGPRRLR